MEDIYQNLQVAFAKGAMDAGKNFQKAENTTIEGGVRYAISQEAKSPTYEQLVSKDPISVIDIGENTDRLSYSDLKKKVLQDARDSKLFDVPHPNRDTGVHIFITEQSFTHTFKNLTSTFGEDTILAMGHIPEIIQEAVLVHIAPPKNPAKAESRVFTFFAAVEGKNGVEPVKLTVKEYAGRKLSEIPQNIRKYFEENGAQETHNRLYDTEVLEVVAIESTKKESGASASVANRNRLVAKGTPNSIIKIADLLRLVNGESKKYIPVSTTDSDGNQLSAGQQSHFSKSKERDADGNLQVMYRGDSEEVTVYDRKKSKPSNLYGRGFYYTNAKSHAGQYGIVRAFYLNTVDPLMPGQHKITKDQMLRFLEAIENDGEDYDLYNYGEGTTAKSVLEKVWGKGDFEMLQDVSASAIGDLVAAVELFNEINGTTYDSIRLPTETVIFNSNQAKLTTNKNPTDNPDIRYSVGRKTDRAVQEMLEKENADLREDVAKLKELLKLQGVETHGNRFLESSVLAAARYIKKLSPAQGQHKRAFRDAQ